MRDDILEENDSTKVLDKSNKKEFMDIFFDKVDIINDNIRNISDDIKKMIKYLRKD